MKKETANYINSLLTTSSELKRLYDTHKDDSGMDLAIEYELKAHRLWMEAGQGDIPTRDIFQDTAFRYYILHTTGGVYDTISGNVFDAILECDERNDIDDSCTSEIHASFDSYEECQKEMYELING